MNCRFLCSHAEKDMAWLRTDDHGLLHLAVERHIVLLIVVT